MRRFTTHLTFAAGLAFAGPLGCKDHTKASGDAAAGGDAPADSADEAEASSEPPAAEDLLARAVEAVGGRKRLDDVHSFYYKGTISILGQNIGGDIEIWWKDGDFYTTEEMAGIGRIQAGKQGDVIWSEDPINGLRKLAGAEAEQHMWASSLMLAADWKRYFETAKTTGERELDGKKVYDVDLTSKSGARVELTFDADTGLLVAEKFEQVTPMGKMPVTVQMGDYRDVDGIKIAHEQTTDASLAKATQKIAEVLINPEVDTSKFAMPSGGAEAVAPSKDGGVAPVAEGEKKKTMMPFDADGKPGKPVPPKK